LLPAVAATVREHDAGSFAWLLIRKFAKVWHWYEEPDNQNFYYYRLHSAVLRYLPITNTVIAPLILVGLILSAPQWRRLIPLYLMAITGIAVCVLTYTYSRYRVQFFAPMLPFAAFTLVRAVEWTRSHRYRDLALLLGGTAAAFLWTSQPLEGRPLIRVADYTAPYTYFWIPEHDDAVAKQDWPRAANLLAGSLEFLPATLPDLGTKRYCQTDDEVQLATLYAVVYQALAEDLRRSGDTAAADRQLRRAGQLEAAARRHG
jgi:hypothetical protein